MSEQIPILVTDRLYERDALHEKLVIEYEVVKLTDHRAAVEKLEALLREWRRVERIWSLMGRSQSRESFDSLNGLCKRTDAALKEDT
jgi:hypothetical protein